MAIPSPDPRAAADAPKGDAVEKRLEVLAREVEGFRVAAQRFLAGDLRLPPEEQRDRIAGIIRQLRAGSLPTTAANFRLGSLEARFNAQLDLFGRRLRAIEEGVAADVQRRKEAAAPPDPERGVVIGERPDAVAVNALYQGLYLRDRRAQPAMDLERFRSYLDRQAEAIRAKTGCDKIQFRVAEEGGKLKLKARPLREPTP